MRLYLGLALCIGLTGASLAQPQTPEEMTNDHTIKLSAGQSRNFLFPSSFDSVKIVTEGVAQAVPQSDRQLSITGVSAGETQMFVYGRGGLIYSADIIVAPEPGRVVRIYGYPDVKDYLGFYYTDIGCGRADKELNGAREVSSVTTVVPNGRAVTRTYGH